jgi:hypothetical protein
MKGHTHADEWKKQLSKRMTGKGNPFYGKHHSEETRTSIL